MTDSTVTIVEMLRDAKLGWIADELVESIALGKQITKPFKEGGVGRASKATFVEPYSEEEEMELVVGTLAQYFLVTPKAWELAKQTFLNDNLFTEVRPDNVAASSRASNPREPVSLGIIGEDGEPFTMFSAEYTRKTLPHLWKLLSEMWPYGHDDFIKHYPGESDFQ